RNTTNDLVGAAFNSISISATNYTLAGARISLGDPAALSGNSLIANAGASGTIISLGIQLSGASGSQQFFTINSGADVTLSGTLSGGSGVVLTKDGTGTLVLTAANSAFTGAIKLNDNGGIVRITNAQALGDTTAGTTVGQNAQLQVQFVSGPIL